MAGISQSKSALASGSLKGCGQCVEIRCTDKEVSPRPQKQHQQLSLHAVLSSWHLVALDAPQVGQTSRHQVPTQQQNLARLAGCYGRTLTEHTIALPCTALQACSTTNTVVAVVTDNCEKCASNQINLSANIFAELAALDLGRIAVEYQAVSPKCCYTSTHTEGPLFTRDA